MNDFFLSPVQNFVLIAILTRLRALKMKALLRFSAVRKMLESVKLKKIPDTNEQPSSNETGPLVPRFLVAVLHIFSTT